MDDMDKGIERNPKNTNVKTRSIKSIGKYFAGCR